jgi:hypothetical protein
MTAISAYEAPSINVDLPLTDAYANVEFDPPPAEKPAPLDSV